MCGILSILGQWLRDKVDIKSLCDLCPVVTLTMKNVIRNLSPDVLLLKWT